MNLFKNTNEQSLIKKIFGIFFVFFILQLLLGSVLIYQVSIKQTTEFLQQISQRVREDITYKNGKWDTRRYNADPNTPGTYPLYILSADGFVIDRWKPIHGFLDTSDVRRLLSYQIPQTITTPTNQTWRIMSRPVISDNTTIGVITVSYYNPPPDAINTIDQNLIDSMNAISSKLVITHNTISTVNLDPRDINFNIAFQVVDNFNRIIAKNNNTNSIDQIPNYIDTSYIGNVINNQPVFEATDTTIHDKFLLVTTPIVDENNIVIGVIVAGRSISYIDQVLHNFIIAEFCLGIILVGLLSFITIRMIRRYIRSLKPLSPTEQKNIEHISFDKKTGKVLLDDEEIVIPYATNQYYLCEALFSHPKKRWEVDELLERFGEQDLTHWRKVYDAMLIINKKTSRILPEKLIIAKDKTYQINPTLLTKIT